MDLNAPHAEELSLNNAFKHNNRNSSSTENTDDQGISGSGVRSNMFGIAHVRHESRLYRSKPVKALQPYYFGNELPELTSDEHDSALDIMEAQAFAFLRGLLGTYSEGYSDIAELQTLGRNIRKKGDR